MSKLLSHLGVSESDIKIMPADIIEAAGIVGAMYKAYGEMEKGHWMKPSLANAIAESVRILLVRVKALIRIPDEVKEKIDNEMKLLPKQQMPKTQQQKSPLPTKQPPPQPAKKKQEPLPKPPEPSPKPKDEHPNPEPSPKKKQSSKKQDGNEHMKGLSEKQKELIRKLKSIEI